MGDAKFLGVKYRVWWLVYFCIQASLILLMGSTFGCQTWVFSNNQANYNDPMWSDSNNNNYNGNSFSGDLFKCTKGCNTNYNTLSSNWCDYHKALTTGQSGDNSTTYPYKSICDMYTGLNTGSRLYVFLEVLSMIGTSIWACGMICYWRKTNCLWLTYCCSGCMWVFHYLAFLGYMGVSYSRFSGDCSSFPTDGSKIPLCAGSGPSLSLFITLIIPFISVFYCVVACKLQRTFGFEGLSKDFNPNLGPGTREVQLPAINMQQPVVYNPVPYANPTGFAPPGNPPQYGIPPNPGYGSKGEYPANPPQPGNAYGIPPNQGYGPKGEYPANPPQPGSAYVVQPNPGNPYSNPAPAGNPYSNPAPAGNPYSNPAPAGNPYSNPAPAGNPYTNPAPAYAPDVKRG